MALFDGVTLLNQAGDDVDGKAATEGKIVLLYFSAMWCGQCRQSTPKVKRFVTALTEAGKNVVIVLVSRDHEEEDALEYFNEGCGKEWLALKFGDDKIGELLTKYEVSGIPALRVVKDDGSLIVQDGKTAITEKGDEPIALFDEWVSA